MLNRCSLAYTAFDSYRGGIYGHATIAKHCGTGKVSLPDEIAGRARVEPFWTIVAIEPDSDEPFLADSFSKAVALARATHPQRVSFVMRVGHAAAVHIGGFDSSTVAWMTPYEH